MAVILLREALSGFLSLALYYAVVTPFLMLIRLRLNPPGELFRKMMHMAGVLSVFVLLHAFDTWYLSALTAVVFAAVIFPAIWCLERYPRVIQFFIQRKTGEIKLTIACVFLVMAVLIGVFWGALGDRWKFIIPTSVLAWGLGDAAAALVGASFGKRHFKFRFANKNKTVEGSLAMCAAAFSAIFISLMIYTSFPWYICLLSSLATAPAAAYAELVSPPQTDTLTVPLFVAMLLFGVLLILNGGAL